MKGNSKAPETIQLDSIVTEKRVDTETQKGDKKIMFEKTEVILRGCTLFFTSHLRRLFLAEPGCLTVCMIQWKKQ